MHPQDDSFVIWYYSCAQTYCRKVRFGFIRSELSACSCTGCISLYMTLLVCHMAFICGSHFIANISHKLHHSNGRGCHVLGEQIIWRQFVIKLFGRAEMDADVLMSFFFRWCLTDSDLNPAELNHKALAYVFCHFIRL